MADSDKPRHTYWVVRLGSASRFATVLGLLIGGLMIWMIVAVSLWLPAPLMLSVMIGWLVCCMAALWPYGRLAVQRSSEGLTEWFTYRWPRRTPWHAIRWVEATDEWCIVQTDHGSWRFGTELQNWRHLVAELRQATGQPELDVPAQRAELLPPEQIAEWLGLTPAERVVQTTWTLGGWATLGLSFAALLVTVMALRGMNPWLVLFIGAYTLLPYMFTRHLRRHYHIVADATGLDVVIIDCPRRIGWYEITDVLWYQPGQYVLATPYGEVPLITHTDAGRRILHAAQQAVAARKQGYQLPEPDLVPTAALSRMGAAEPPSERGISIVERSGP